MSEANRLVDDLLLAADDSYALALLGSQLKARLVTLALDGWMRTAGDDADGFGMSSPASPWTWLPYGREI